MKEAAVLKAVVLERVYRQRELLLEHVSGIFLTFKSFSTIQQTDGGVIRQNIEILIDFTTHFGKIHCRR